MPVRRLLSIGVLLASAFASVDLAAQSTGPDRPERLFNAQCARCHGVGGTGGEGPALQGRQFRTVSARADLPGLIRDGLGAMPGSWWISNGDVEHIADYVWGLARVSPEAATGDPEAGRRVFEDRNRCLRCHIVGGVGTGLGPELTDIGARRGLEYLRRSIVAPGEDLPRGEITPHSSFLIVTATTGDGTRVRGLRIREDAFTLLLRDRDGLYHSLRKADLSAVEREPSASLMPDYAGRLSEAEVEDLVAYLASLRGK